MKIAIIAHSLHPIIEPFAGGLEMVTFLLSNSLLARGHEVDLYAHEDSDARFNIIPIISSGEIGSEDSMYSTSPSTISSNSLLEVIGYTKIMMKIANGGYDIVHNHSLHYLPIIIGNGLSTPMITSIHTPKFDFLRLAANELRCDYRQTFTMVSNSLALTWKDLIPHTDVVYNGIDLAAWDFVSKPTGDYLFWYGRICPEKGTDLAILAALKSGHKIILAGPISNQIYYKKLVAPLLNLPDVEYVGHLSQKSIVPLLQNAKVLLFTSIWEEPYGLTLAESLACGTPVAAYDVGATKEILTENCGVIVPSKSVYKLAKAILKAKLLNREECRKRAEEFCSHVTMVDGYLNLYDSLLEHHDYNLRRIP